MIYELCANQVPFRAPDLDGIYRKVLRGKYEQINVSVYSS